MGIPSRKRLLSRDACAIHSESLTCSVLLTSICIPGSPTRSGTSPRDIEPPRSMGYPYSRRIAATSRSPSAPLRCDRFPPFARLASPACEFLTFCGVAYHLPSSNVSCGLLTAVEERKACLTIAAGFVQIPSGVLQSRSGGSYHGKRWAYTFPKPFQKFVAALYLAGCTARQGLSWL